ncbi:S4 domain-containing protein YaaA [Aerococcus suis]|nr:S4 domain-containing protein YaaA [Aerococcus suis]
MQETITIDTEFITVTQVLKYVGAIGTGGQSKWFLQEHPVQIDGELEDRRGKKVYPGQVVTIPGEGHFTIVQADDAHEA